MGYSFPFTEVNKMNAKQVVISCDISGYLHVFEAFDHLRCYAA
jgi:hypothetical protein